MVGLQQQARALGDPTRHEIFRYIAEAPSAVGVAELTTHLGVNHNAVRQHLAKLVDARLVAESTRASTGPGRPRLQYVVHPSADSRWGVLGSYERLSLLLTEVVRTGDSPAEVGRRAGVGASSNPLDTDDAVASVTAEMARFGFEPTVQRRRGGVVDITLHACPFETAALADPATVCELHRGMALGVADAVGGVVVDELVPTDPRRPRCRLRCHVEPVTGG